MPILGNLLVQVRDAEMTLTATDLEVELRTLTTVQCDSEGEFTLPARKFIDICKALPEESEIEVELRGEKALIRANKSRFSLGVLPAADYPSMEAAAPELAFYIREGTLKNLVDKTAFAMAQQDVRYYLNGMLLEIGATKIRSVATDGHRLALSEAAVELDLEGTEQVLLPRKAVLELGRLLDYTDAMVRVECSKSFARFRAGSSVFTTKLIDGRFPDYDRVIPKNVEHTATVDREQLRNSLSRASILSGDKYKGVRLTFSQDRLRLQAHNPEQEEAEDEVEMEFKGEDLTIGFNVGYLLDILGTVDSPSIAIDLGESDSSAVVRIPGDENHLYVVMPMRL